MTAYQKFTHTLGPTSAKLINKFLQQGKIIFTLSEASFHHAKDRDQTAKFLSGLVKRGILIRIKSGVYSISQIGHENTQLKNWPILARELACSNLYFISYYSAMRLHGMTTHPLMDVYITTPKREKTKKISDITYHFIYSKPDHFWGYKAHWATKQEKIMISDLERTLLDAFERPELCGGIKEVVRGIWIKQKEINWKKIIEYSTHFRTKAAVKRLGLILEILEIGNEHTPLLSKIIYSAKGYNLFDPSGPKKGKYIGRWRIQLNMSVKEIKESIWA